MFYPAGFMDVVQIEKTKDGVPPWETTTAPATCEASERVFNGETGAWKPGKGGQNLDVQREKDAWDSRCLVPLLPAGCECYHNNY